MNYHKAIEQLRTELSTNKAKYTHSQLMNGYEVLELLTNEYLTLVGVKRNDQIK